MSAQQDKPPKHNKPPKHDNPSSAASKLWIKTDFSKQHETVLKPEDSQPFIPPKFKDSGRRPKTVVILGAGVIGSIVAAALLRVGCRVTLIARGQRKAQLEQWGLVLQKIGSDQRERWQPRVIENMSESGGGDWLIIAVQRGQIDELLPVIARTSFPNILLMTNNAAGFDRYRSLIGARLTFGFPAAGGENRQGVIHYYSYFSLVSIMQPTILGEMDGPPSHRLIKLTSQLRQGGLYSIMSSNMEAWLATRARVLLAIAEAVYRNDDSLGAVLSQPEQVCLMIQGIQRNLLTLNSLGLPIIPFRMKLLLFPPKFLAPLITWYLGRERISFVLESYIKRAKEELKILQSDIETNKTRLCLKIYRQCGK